MYMYAYDEGESAVGVGCSGKMRRSAARRFLAITSEGKFTIIETTACEFRMQVCLRHSSALFQLSFSPNLSTYILSFLSPLLFSFSSFQ